MCFSENGANPLQKNANYGLHRMTKALRKMFFSLMGAEKPALAE